MLFYITITKLLWSSGIWSLFPNHPFSLSEIHGSSSTRAVETLFFSFFFFFKMHCCISIHQISGSLAVSPLKLVLYTKPKLSMFTSNFHVIGNGLLKVYICWRRLNNNHRLCSMLRGKKKTNKQTNKDGRHNESDLLSEFK